MFYFDRWHLKKNGETCPKYSIKIPTDFACIPQHIATKSIPELWGFPHDFPQYKIFITMLTVGWVNGEKRKIVDKSTNRVNWLWFNLNWIIKWIVAMINYIRFRYTIRLNSLSPNSAFSIILYFNIILLVFGKFYTFDIAFLVFSIHLNFILLSPKIVLNFKLRPQVWEDSINICGFFLNNGA